MPRDRGILGIVVVLAFVGACSSNVARQHSHGGAQDDATDLAPAGGGEADMAAPPDLSIPDLGAPPDLLPAFAPPPCAASEMMHDSTNQFALCLRPALTAFVADPSMATGTHPIAATGGGAQLSGETPANGISGTASGVDSVDGTTWTIH